ncbi:MAG: hypothetical protein WCV41_04630 [Patescibacteria group bacterium]
MNKIIEFLLQHNETQSKLFCSPDIAGARRQHRGRHDTEIAALKCMDGRLNVSVCTKIPPGIIQPFRNLGGQFDVGWPFLNKLLLDWVTYVVSNGKNGVVLVTYHWSKGNQHRGCAGFNYDTEAAKSYTANLTRNIEKICGQRHAVIYPLHVGIETDEDALVLHGSNGNALNVADLTEATKDELRMHLQNCYPDMNDKMVQDILPLLSGNQHHILEVRQTQRPLNDIEHRECVLGIGRGFGWLHVLNKALLIGPFSPNLDEPIVKAAKILLDNLNEGRIPKEDGVALLSSAVFRDEAGFEPGFAAAKSNTLADFALSVIKSEVPELYKYLHVLKGIVNQNTMLMTVIE